MRPTVKELIEELEIGLRQVIKSFLQQKYAGKWIQVLENSMEPEEKRNFQRDKFKSENELINYANIGTLKTFVYKEWQELRNTFKDKVKFEECLNTVISVRNALAHNRNIPGRELKRAEVCCEDLLDMINPKWKEQLAKRKREENKVRLRRTLVISSIAVLILGFSFSVFYYHKSKRIPVIDVLPFKNLSKDTSLDNFSGVFAEVVKNKLALCDKLFVMDSSNSESIEKRFIVKNAYAAEEKELASLKSFGVNILIKGSFIRSGDRLKVMVSIVDLDRNRVINSTEYEGLWNDSEILDVQNKLAYKIIEALNISLNPIQKQNINNVALPNPAAYEYFSKSWDLYLQGRYREVIDLCNKALSIDPKYLDAYRRMGNTYEMIGDIDKALKQYKLWEKIAYDNNDPSSLAWAFINIGRIYKFKDDHDKELYYYNKSLEISLKSRNDLNIARAYNSLGNWYYHKKLYREAQDNFFKAVAINQAKDYIYNHKYNLAGNYLAIGKVFDASKEFEKAEEYYKKSLALYEELEGKVGVAENYCLLAELAFRDKQYDVTADYYKKALTIDSELKNIEKAEEIEDRIKEINRQNISLTRNSPSAESEESSDFEEKYKDRSSLFLLYDISVKVNEDWSYTTKLHKKIKVLKEEAKDSLGEIPIYYEKGREKVTEVQACTTTSDGKEHMYSKTQDLNIYEGYTMYSDSMVKVITLPEVNVGSTLEHRATVISKGLPIKNAFWYYFDFNFPAPIKKFNLTITLPKKFAISYKEFKLSYQPKIIENEDTITYSWSEKNIEGKKESEDYLPPPITDSITNVVEFSSIKDWSDISKWFSALVEKNSILSDTIKDTTQKVTKVSTNNKDKVRDILEYIQHNFRYVSMSFGDNSLEPHSTAEVFQNKYGDCKDLSLLCMTMLKAIGIKASMTLFNTEFSISDPKYDLPLPSLFDHVILLVEDKKDGDFFIDPLLDGYDVGQFPLNYQGAHTFVITENGGRFIQFPIFDEKRGYTKSERKITIGQDGSALIETVMIWDLDSSIEQRYKINSMNKEDKDKFYQSLGQYLASGGEVLECRIDGLDQKYGSIKARSKIRKKGAYQITDGMIIIDVPGYGRDTDFLEKERKNPIFYPSNSLEEEITTYIIPEGYKVSYMPENLNLDIGFFNMKREYTKGGSEIIIKETTRYKRTQLPKENYGKIKDFYDQLPSKTKQRIMLKK